MGFRQEQQMFFVLDEREFGSAIGACLGAAESFVEVKNACAYFSNEEGTGRLTPIVSNHLVEFIKHCIDSPGEAGIEGIVSWTEPTKKWHDIAKQWGTAGGFQHWKFRGHVQENVAVIYRGRHSRTVGIRRKTVIQNIWAKKKSQRKILVSKYAAFREFGTSKKQPQPLFVPATEIFIRKYFPKYIKAVKKAFDNAYKEGFYIGEAKWVKKRKHTVSKLVSSSQKIRGKLTGTKSPKNNKHAEKAIDDVLNKSGLPSKRKSRVKKDM